MNIKDIKLENYRNYKNQKIEFNPKVNIIYGNNGEGKTNIIEAIFLCAIGKSYRTNHEQELISFNNLFTNIELNVERKDREYNIKVNIDKKKKIFINNIQIKKYSELLGHLNAVIFNPDDIEILKAGPSKRRRFLDIMISQLRPNYVLYVNNYMKTLEQRNNYLKQLENSDIDNNLLDVWDEKLADFGEKVYSYRYEFINKIIEKINDIHSKITEEKENLKIEYLSDCENKEEYLEKLKTTRKIDIIRGNTSKGVHHDDFKIYINDKEANIYGSQGQQRSIVLSLKLSELQIIEEEIGETPVLLLDDFMSELDSTRRTKFMENIEGIQQIITCTDKFKIKGAKYINIRNGEVKNGREV